MAARIVFSLPEFRSPRDERWQLAAGLLEELGADHITPPRAELPGIATAVLPDEERAREAVEQLRTVEGIATAELDAWRFTS